jgi:predicted  nucleic acid-binding Zn-ribbon protein
MINILTPEFKYKSKITKTFEKIMTNYASFITTSPDIDDYQNKITTVLSILEMCIRIIFVSNTKGIFKALPDYSEIVINEKDSTTDNEANKFGDLVEDKFTKNIKNFYKQLIVNFSVLKQKREEEQLQLARNSINTRSVTKELESNLGKMANVSNTNVVGTPILETGPPSINEGKEVSGLIFSSSSENSPVKMEEATQIDDVLNENDNIERLQNEINGLNQEKQILQNKIKDLENKLKRCEQDLENHRSKTFEIIEEEDRKRLELQYSISQLKNELKLCNEKNNEILDDNFVEKTEFEKILTQNEEFREINKNLEHTHTTMKDAIKNLTVQLKKCNEEKKILEEQIQKLKDDLKKRNRNEENNIFPNLTLSSPQPAEEPPLVENSLIQRKSPRLSNVRPTVQTSEATFSPQDFSPPFMRETESSKRKRQLPKKKTGGTFKKYQNKFKYSIKNRPQLKNKSIKNNKRKHTKTYKRK